MTFERSEVEAVMVGLQSIQIIPDVQERRRKEGLLKERLLKAFSRMHSSERVVAASRVCRQLLMAESLAVVRRDVVHGLEGLGLSVSMPARFGTEDPQVSVKAE